MSVILQRMIHYRQLTIYMLASVGSLAAQVAHQENRRDLAYYDTWTWHYHTRHSIVLEIVVCYIIPLPLV